MSRELLARIRKGREFKQEVGAFVFVLRRPTDVEAVDLHRSAVGPAAVAQKFVVGWEKVTENDIVGGGGSDPVAFDPVLWAEWCADRPDFWGPIAAAALKAYAEHAESLEQIAKN